MNKAVIIKDIKNTIKDIKKLNSTRTDDKSYIAHLKQVIKDLHNPDYDAIFTHYSDSYKDMYCSRPRPHFPPTISDMNSFFARYDDWLPTAHMSYDDYMAYHHDLAVKDFAHLIKDNDAVGAMAIGDLIAI